MSAADHPTPPKKSLGGSVAAAVAGGLLFGPALMGGVFDLIHKKHRAEDRDRLYWALTCFLDHAGLPRGDVLDVLASVLVVAAQAWGAPLEAVHGEIDRQWPLVLAGLKEAAAQDVARKAHEQNPTLTTWALWVIEKAALQDLTIVRGKEEAAGEIAKVHKDDPAALRAALLQAGVAEPVSPAAEAGGGP